MALLVSCSYEKDVSDTDAQLIDAVKESCAFQIEHTFIWRLSFFLSLANTEELLPNKLFLTE